MVASTESRNELLDSFLNRFEGVPEGRCKTCREWPRTRLSYYPLHYRPWPVTEDLSSESIPDTCPDCGFSPPTIRVEFSGEWRGLHSRAVGERRVPAVRLPSLLEHQEPYVYSSARYKILSCGRRWGKTLSSLSAVLVGHGPDGKFLGALQGEVVWWVTRNGDVASQVWRALKDACTDVYLHKSEIERRMVFPGGGSVTVKSAESGSLRGDALSGLILDEAAYLPEDVWSADLRPALADTRGWAVHISTPAGYNHFSDIYEVAEKDETGLYYAQQSPSHENPRLHPDELEEARKQLGPLMYKQEILGEFVSGTGALISREWFRFFDVEGAFFRLFKPDGDVEYVRAKECWFMSTVDVSASIKETADYTVISTFAVTPNNELLHVHQVRRRMEGPDITPALRSVYEVYKPQAIWVERNGMGLLIIQEAVRAGLPIRELKADRDKRARAMPLQARMEQGAVYFAQHAEWLGDLLDELLRFTGDKDRHDDQVDALAYAAALLPQETAKPFIVPNFVK